MPTEIKCFTLIGIRMAIKPNMSWNNFIPLSGAFIRSDYYCNSPLEISVAACYKYGKTEWKLSIGLEEHKKEVENMAP